jgi:hypothetical protein
MFLMTLKRGKFMTNMEKMHSKKGWEAAAVICIVPSTYLNNCLVVVALAGVAQEVADKNVVKMWCIL